MLPRLPLHRPMDPPPHDLLQAGEAAPGGALRCARCGAGLDGARARSCLERPAGAVTAAEPVRCLDCLERTWRGAQAAARGPRH